MLSYLKIYRPLNLIFIGVAQILAAYFLYFDSTLSLVLEAGVLWLAIGTVTIAAFAYWMNDYYDFERDAINKEGRMNVRSLSKAILLIHLLSFLLIIFLAANHLNSTITICFILSLITLWLYNFLLKDYPLIGNMLIGILSFISVFMVGWLFVEIDKRLLLHYGLLAGLVNFCRELVKDAEDLEGDRATGSKTIAVIWGIETVNKIVYYSILFTISFIVISLYYQKQYYSGALLYVYWSFYLIFVVIPLYQVALDIKFVIQKSDYTKLSRKLKYILYTGILSILFF